MGSFGRQSQPSSVYGSIPPSAITRGPQCNSRLRQSHTFVSIAAKIGFRFASGVTVRQ